MRWLAAGALGLCTLLGGVHAAPAQQPPRVVEVITATGDARDVAIAGDRLLVATSGGLVIRRGERVERVLGARDGLPGARLRSVSLTEDGAWVGGVEGTALIALEGGAEPRVARTVPVRRVRRAVRFGGSIWLGSHGDGLHRMATADGAVVPVSLGRHHALSRVTDLAVWRGELWVATAGAGLIRLGPDGSIRGRLRAGLADPMVWDLEPDGDHLLAATLGGLTVIGPEGVRTAARETALARRLPVRDVRSIARRGEELWVATYGGGVWRLGEGARPRRARGVEAPRPQALVSTSGGVVVAHDGGLALGDARGRLSSLSSTSLPSADVTALARAFGALWIGTFDRGLARLERGRVVEERRAVERWGVDRRVNDLAVTRDHHGAETLWIATDRGLWWHDGRRFSPALDARAPVGEHVTSMHVDGKGALWVTSSRQLARHHHGRWQSWTGDERFPVMQLHAVTSDADGRIWVGSLHGLYRFDPGTGRFERHTVSSGALPVDWVTAVVPWGRGVVAGTYHGGLSWHDGSVFRVEAPSRGGLPAGWVNPHAMRWIGDELWVGTLERGLVVGRSGSWAHLRIDDGLPSDDVTDVLEGPGGEVWVATRGGLARLRR